MTPKVSIIVPVYKVEPYLEQCVRSLICQTLRDIEIILVDDGSPDGCPAICDRLAASDPRIRVIHKQNEGLGMARNTGLEVAGGEWVLFVDSDDFIALNTLEYLISIADTHPETDQIRFLSTGFTDSVFPECVDIRCDITGKITEISDFHSKLLPILGNLASLPDGVTTEVVSLASAWSAIYRRSVFVSSGIRFESERQFISEDYVFNIEFAAVSRSIIFTPERFYYIRYNPGSLTRSLRRDRIEKSSFLCSHIERRLVTLGFDPSLAAYLSMGLMLVYMRAHTDHIISAPIPVAEKKQLFREMAADPLVSRIASDYRFPKGSGRHRLLFALRNSYLPTAFLVHLTLLVKRVLKKG